MESLVILLYLNDVFMFSEKKRETFHFFWKGARGELSHSGELEYLSFIQRYSRKEAKVVANAMLKTMTVLSRDTLKLSIIRVSATLIKTIVSQ